MMWMRKPQNTLVSPLFDSIALKRFETKRFFLNEEKKNHELKNIFVQLNALTVQVGEDMAQIGRLLKKAPIDQLRCIVVAGDAHDQFSFFFCFF